MKLVGGAILGFVLGALLTYWLLSLLFALPVWRALPAHSFGVFLGVLTLASFVISIAIAMSARRPPDFVRGLGIGAPLGLAANALLLLWVVGAG
jgi:hypothetical protein